MKLLRFAEVAKGATVETTSRRAWFEPLRFYALGPGMGQPIPLD